MKCKIFFQFPIRKLVSIDEKKILKKVASKTVRSTIFSPAAQEIFIDTKANMIEGFTVNVMFTDDESIHEINKTYRNVDKSTDVLSFPINDFQFGNGEVDFQNVDEDLNMLLLGDVIISVPTMKKQANEYAHSIERECAFLICHSILHLLGYDHMNDTDEQEMMGYTEDILQKIGYVR